jgi:glucose/arabinose dehydrogenase
MDSDSNLWITTGDAADEDNPQDPDSLGGKILRVNRNGEGVDGNMEEPFDPRIFSYGHRNSQGIELIDGLKDPEFEKEVFGLTSEHGPDVDDEINLLAKGNFGWDPDPGYNENVPMTDTEKYPEAVKAVWNSGSETVATSGIEYVQGEEWGEWENSLLLATLKDSYIQRFEVEETGDVTPQEKIVTGYGRIRQIYQGSSGMLYFTTDNSNGNDIIAIIESK